MEESKDTPKNTQHGSSANVLQTLAFSCGISLSAPYMYYWQAWVTLASLKSILFMVKIFVQNTQMQSKIICFNIFQTVRAIMVYDSKHNLILNT